MRHGRRLCVSLDSWGSSPSPLFSPPRHLFLSSLPLFLPRPSSTAFGFRGNITRKWWLACECRYHFLARYQPALPVITAPPGLRHGLLDKPPTAKVYCLFHLPLPSMRRSFSRAARVSYPVLFYRALLRRFSIPETVSLALSFRSSSHLSLSLVLHRRATSSSCGKCAPPSLYPHTRFQLLPTLRDV